MGTVHSSSVFILSPFFFLSFFQCILLSLAFIKHPFMYKALQVITTTHKPSHHFPFVQNILGKLRCNLESNTYLGLTLAYCHGLNVYLANVPVVEAWSPNYDFVER